MCRKIRRYDGIYQREHVSALFKGHDVLLVYVFYWKLNGSSKLTSCCWVRALPPRWAKMMNSSLSCNHLPATFIRSLPPQSIWSRVKQSAAWRRDWYNFFCFVASVITRQGSTYRGHFHKFPVQSVIGTCQLRIRKQIPIRWFVGRLKTTILYEENLEIGGQ